MVGRLSVGLLVLLIGLSEHREKRKAANELEIKERRDGKRTHSNGSEGL